jgi:hypothetical protein
LVLQFAEIIHRVADAVLFRKLFRLLLALFLPRSDLPRVDGIRVVDVKCQLLGRCPSTRPNLSPDSRRESAAARAVCA